jgi:hypothetical protein
VVTDYIEPDLTWEAVPITASLVSRWHNCSLVIHHGKERYDNVDVAAMLASWSLHMYPWELQLACIDIPGFLYAHPTAPLNNFRAYFIRDRFGSDDPSYNLHAYIWEDAPEEVKDNTGNYAGHPQPWFTPKHVPLNMHEFICVRDEVHKDGMRLVVYVSPELATAPDIFAQMRRVLDEYQVDGLYFDGAAAEFRNCYTIMRGARQILGDDRILYYHGSSEPFYDDRIYCPFIDTYADYILRGVRLSGYHAHQRDDPEGVLHRKAWKDLRLTSDRASYVGRIRATRDGGGRELCSLETDRALPAGERLAGQILLADNPDGTSTTPYVIERVEATGKGSRVFLHGVYSFLLSRGRVDAISGDTVTSDAPHPKADFDAWYRGKRLWISNTPFKIAEVRRPGAGPGAPWSPREFVVAEKDQRARIKIGAELQVIATESSARFSIPTYVYWAGGQVVSNTSAKAIVR